MSNIITIDNKPQQSNSYEWKYCDCDWGGRVKKECGKCIKCCTCDYHISLKQKNEIKSQSIPIQQKVANSTIVSLSKSSHKSKSQQTKKGHTLSKK